MNEHDEHERDDDCERGHIPPGGDPRDEPTPMHPEPHDPPGGDPTDPHPAPGEIDRIIPDREYSDVVTVVQTVTDHNQAIQNALDKKGTVQINAGEYEIDCTRPLLVRSNTYVKIQPGAKFYALPHGLQRSQLFKIENVNNVRVTGGEFYGERDKHDYSDDEGTGTHEWNHAFAVYSASAITLENIRAENFSGDGFSIGGGGEGTKPPSEDVVMSKCVSKNNRRQGLSITNSRNVRIYDSQFLDTNGTSPECGIDVEPEYGQRADDVQIVGCLMRNNKKYGLNILHRTGSDNPGGTIARCTVAECTIQENQSNGAYAHSVDGLFVENNSFLTNSATGFVFSACSDFKYQNNESGFNYSRNPLSKPRTPFTQTGWSSKIERDVLLKNNANAGGVKTNHYV